MFLRVINSAEPAWPTKYLYSAVICMEREIVLFIFVLLPWNSELSSHDNANPWVTPGTRDASSRNARRLVPLEIRMSNPA